VSHVRELCTGQLVLPPSRWSVFPVRQSVLIISGYAADRETIPLLVGSMGCRCILAPTLDEALATLNREPTAAAILDSRLVIAGSEDKNEILREILVRLPGRVILLLNEPYDPAAVDFATAYSLPFINRDRWAQDLWGSLETLLRRPAVAHRVKETARLALDTFRQPLPVGIRFSQANSRHLLYETSSLSIDISFEQLLDSNSTSLGGQILTNADPTRALAGAPVRLRGRERSLGFAMTSQSGEFFFQFEREPNVILEIEDRPNHSVTIYSPNAIWLREDGSQNAQERDNGQPTRRHGKKHCRDEER
jgi:hypothetical protein